MILIKTKYSCLMLTLTILPPTLSSYQIALNNVVATVTVGYGIDGIAYDSGKDEIFVANTASDSVSVISDSNNTVVGTVAFPFYPHGNRRV